MNHSDEKLFYLCKKYGTQAKIWRQKFIGLLPEVFKRNLYAKKGFPSIFEFAAILCGLSEAQVRLALNLEKRCEDKPLLREMFVEGEVSMNKLARVVSIATPENEEQLAAQIKLLPQKALETLVRDIKLAQALEREKEEGRQGVENQNGCQEPLFDAKSLRAQNAEAERRHASAESGHGNNQGLNFELSAAVVEELNLLNNQGHDVNALLLHLLAQDRKSTRLNSSH